MFFASFPVFATLGDSRNFPETLQMSPVFLHGSTEVLHLQWDSSPKDDKRFNLLLAMSKGSMSNNLLRVLLAGDGAKMLGVQISTEAGSGEGTGNCSRCWRLFGAQQDWYERIGVRLYQRKTLSRCVIAIKIVNHSANVIIFIFGGGTSTRRLIHIYLRHFPTFILKLPPFSFSYCALLVAEAIVKPPFPQLLSAAR